MKQKQDAYRKARPVTKQTRNTRQRQMVLDAVLAHRNHPNAEQLYFELRLVNAKISRGTVYRNLKILSQCGIIQNINISGIERFDRRVEPHPHLLCTDCGALCDASLPYKAHLDQELAEQTGYQINRHQTIFEGVCPDCQSRR